MSDKARIVLLWVVVAVVLMTIFSSISSNMGAVERPYSELIMDIDQDNILEVVIEENDILVTRKDRTKYKTYSPETDNGWLIGQLSENGVTIKGQEAEGTSLFQQILLSWLPIIVIVGVWIFFMRQMQGGGSGKGGAFSFGKSKARLLNEDQVKVSFNDVAGAEEAKEEVGELVEFLRDPGKFQRLGGKIPRGVLMVGSPGTGKTLLAKAIAGEAKVPFFTISGSDFVEMFVGVGASRVRDMFEQAKKQSPCIIFIDEIDAVGRHRGAGLGGGHDEREQTLNQLLVEMDGFEGNEGVIVIAATNRPDVLDPALLRPGRFDRQVVVPLPDIKGREQILKVHMRKVPLAEDVVPKVIARGTPGFSGADLANVVNEAALFAARENKRVVDMDDFEKAKDKIMMGAERRSMVMSEEEKRNTAYHESGHAIVGYLMPSHDPIHKVTIIPRGRALGVTFFLPEQDKFSASRQSLNSQIVSLYGGRIAEEMIFGEGAVTTGASNDIQRATELARNMVTKWGLSDLGPQAFGENQEEVFLGHSVSQNQTISGATMKLIDEEVRRILDDNYAQAKQILTDNIDKLHSMSDALMKYETLDQDQVKEIMEGLPVSEPEGWNGNGDSGSGNGDAGTEAEEKATVNVNDNGEKEDIDASTESGTKH
mgnify:CR=1 FL=1